MAGGALLAANAFGLGALAGMAEVEQYLRAVDSG
jgi:hypothetical protein